MKKTLTVNLAGSVYHIDEDAYVLLDNYLNNLRYHFRKDDGAEEIVRDMEARIAELFTEYIREGKQVITIENVEAVISRMGKPEDLNDGADGKRREDEGDERASRRLFRNPDDRVLGGVASGLAAYFGWDVVWVRIVLILAGLWIQGLFLVYLLAWIIIPLARTATEKLQMRGKPINVSNIGKTVTDGFEQENESTGDERPHSRMRRLGDAVVTVVGCLLKLFLILVAICFAPVLLIGLVVLFALLMAATGMLVSIPAVFYEVLPYVDWGMVGASSGTAVAIAVCGLLAVGIPAVGLLQLVMQGLGTWKPMPPAVKVVLVLLWLVSVAVGVVFLLQAPFVEYSYFM